MLIVFQHNRQELSETMGYFFDLTGRIIKGKLIVSHHLTTQDSDSSAAST